MRRRKRLFRQSLAAWLLPALLLVGRMAQAADSTDPIANERSLSTWVDGDVGICLEFDSLPQHWAAFHDGPLGSRLFQFPPLVAWRQKNRELFTALGAEMERRTGTRPHELCTGLLGRRILFAIWPPANPAVGKPSALLLAEASDRELMRRTLESFITARKKVGRWRGVRTLDIARETFAIHVVAPDDEQSEFFITSTDDVAMVASSEPLLRAVLERRADPEKKASLARSPAYLAARACLRPRAAARVFVNPRAWDLALEADLKRKQPDSQEARSQAAIVAAWAATDYVAAGVQLAPRFAAELAWKWRPNDLPGPVREVAASLSGETALAGDLPSDALLAFAIHADIGRIIRQAIAREWQKSAGKAVGNAEQGSVFVWALAAGFGPDLAGYLIAPSQPPTSADSPRFPLEALLAVQTRPLEPTGAQPALVHQIEPFLHAWLSAAVAAANQRSGGRLASIENQQSSGEGGRTTVVSGIVPGHPQQELAYRVDEKDHLWAATSAALLHEDSTAAGKRLDDDPLTAVGPGPHGHPSGLAYINLAQWRKMAALGREAMGFLWQGKRLDEQAKQRQYRELLAMLQLADRLCLTSRVDETTVHVSLSISADVMMGSDRQARP